MSRTPINIPFRKKGFSHKKCFLAETKGCSDKISGEHYISYNLLNKIEKNNRTIDIAGLSWLPKEQLRSIGRTNLVTNILCRTHNSELSALDIAAGRLVEAIGSIDE